MPRIKAPVTEPLTRDQVEALVHEIALAMNGKRQLMSEVDVAKLAIDRAYASSIAPIDEKLNKHLAEVQQWAEANPAEFASKRSITFASGTIGFRSGMPSFKPLRKASMEAILKAMQAVKRFAAYIRTVEEINKEKIIADHSAGLLTNEDLASVSARISQAESFFIEPNLTTPETRVAEPASQ